MASKAVRKLRPTAAALASLSIAACGGSTSVPSTQDLGALIHDVCSKEDQAACIAPQVKEQCTPELEQAQSQAEQAGCVSSRLRPTAP